jgi:recombinational DNA repair protein (RecF pathway)
MNLLQLIGVTNTFHHCAECSRLVQPAILAHNTGNHTSSCHCFRCYHILAAVRIAPFNDPIQNDGKGGVKHG